MNTDNPDSPAQGTSPLNFGGSNPFTSGQTEPLADIPADTTPATDHDPVTETQPAVETPVVEEQTLTTEVLPAHTHSTIAAEDASDEQVTENLGSSDSAGDSPVATETEQVGEVTASTIEQEETAPVVPADVSTTPAADLAPNAEVPATPQTQLEAEVAKELEVQASNPAEAAVASTDIPAEAPTIAGKTDAEIEADIKARDALNAKIEDGQKAQRQDVITQIKKVVETYKIPLAELGEALGIKGTRKGSKAKPKYRNPADGKEWSGRGKEPLWIKGKDRTEFLITA